MCVMTLDFSRSIIIIIIIKYYVPTCIKFPFTLEIWLCSGSRLIVAPQIAYPSHDIVIVKPCSFLWARKTDESGHMILICKDTAGVKLERKKRLVI